MYIPLSTPASAGQGLFLAGPSSCGKASLAHALQEVLPEPWVFLPADEVSAGYPKERKEFVTLEWDRRLRHGTMLATRGFLDAGVNVIAEQGLWDEWAISVAATIFSPYRAFVVRLRCELAVREAREAERAEILSGFTRWHESNLPWDFHHDLVIDSDHEDPATLARRVDSWLRTSPTPTAWQQILAESDRRLS